MSTKYPGGFISSTEPTVSPLSAKGIWTLAEALRYKTAGEWPVSPTYVAIQGVFATANVGQAESVIPVLLTGLQATGSVNDLTVIGSAIVALDTVSGTGGIGQVSISLPVEFDQYFNLNSMLLADSLANTFITDEGPNKFVITPNGDTRPSAFSPYNGGWSNYFDGTGDYLSVADNEAFTMGSGDFTIECWVYSTKTGAGQVILGNANSAGSGAVTAFQLTKTATNKLQAFVRTTVNKEVNSTDDLPLNQWVHIAMVRNGTFLRLYVNGSEFGTAADLSTDSLVNSADPVSIGRSGSYDAIYFEGHISNVRIVKGTAVYTSAFTPPTSPLTAVSGTSLLTCQSNRLIDNSTNNFAITKTGDVKVMSFGPFTETDTSTGSGYFDGSGDYLSVPASSTFTLGTSDHTIEFWMYANGAQVTQYSTQWEYASGAAQQATNDYYFQASPTDGGFFGLLLGAGGSWAFIINGGAAKYNETINRWNHIAITRQGNTFRLFMNGLLVGSATSSASIGAQSGEMRIGSDNATNYHKGWISDFRFVKGTALYTSNFTPPTEPLTAIAGTQLLTLQHRVSYNNSQPIDESGIKNIITRNGNASVGAYSPFVPSGWSVFFDGTDYISVPDSDAIYYGAGDFTVEAFIYNTAGNPGVGGTQQIIGQQNTASVSGRGWTFSVSGTSTSVTSLYGELCIGSTQVGLNATGLSMPLFTWHHVAFVRSGSNLYLYLNGTQVATRTVSGTVNNSALAVSIGRNGQSGFEYYFFGYISNLRILKGTALYTTSTIDVPTSPLAPITNTGLLCLRSPQLVDDGPARLALTRVGDIRVTPSSPFAPNTIAPDSYSVYFDGTGDWLNTADSDAYNVSTGDFTVEFWMNADNNQAAYAQMCGQRNSAGSVNADSPFGIYRNNTANNLTFFYWNGSSGVEPSTPNNAVYDSNWHHIALVRNGTDFRLYVDGQSSASLTLASGFSFSNSTTQFSIGRHGEYNGQYFKGYISNFRFVKGTAVYTANFTPPTAPLTAISGTSLLTCQSSTVIDNSTNDFAITVNGNSQPTKFNPFGETVTSNVEYTPTAHGGSVYFDGSGDYLIPTANSAYSFGTGAFTIEFWIYPTSTAAPQGVGGIGPASTGNQQIFYNLASSGKIRYNVYDGSFVESSSVPLSTWTHVAIVRAGTGTNQTKVYTNGVLSNSGTITNNFTDTNLVIGRTYYNLNQEYFGGYLSNFRIVKGTAVYTAAFVPPAAPVSPIAATTLLTCGNNAAIYDYTGKNVLETVGNARTVQETPYRDNHSVYFDGTGDSLTRAFTSTTDGMYLQGTTYTIEAWVYPNALSGTQYIYICNATNTAQYGYNTLYLSGTSAAFATRIATGGTEYARSGGTLIVGQWAHVAVSVSSGVAKLFLNGVQVGADLTIAANSFTPTGAGIGKNQNGASGGTDFNGYISNLRIVQGTAVYTANFTPPTSPLTAVSGTSLLTCNTYNFTDSSTNNFTITRNGDARISSRGPFVQNEGDRCMYFDGTGDKLLSASYQENNLSSGDFTVECWVYLNTTASEQLIFMVGNPGNISTGADIQCSIYHSGGSLFVRPYSGTTEYGINVGAVVAGSWYHVALVRSGSSFKGYLNGNVSATTRTISGNLNNSTAFRAVCGLWTIGGTDRALNGYIDDLRITKGFARYTINFDPPSEPLPKV